MLQLRCSGIYFRRNRTETRKRGKSHHNRSYLRPTSEHHPKGSSPYEGNHRPGTVISRRKQLSHLHHGGISPRRHLPSEASPPRRHLPSEASPHGGVSTWRHLQRRIIPHHPGMVFSRRRTTEASPHGGISTWRKDSPKPKPKPHP